MHMRAILTLSSSHSRYQIIWHFLLGADAEYQPSVPEGLISEVGTNT